MKTDRTFIIFWSRKRIKYKEKEEEERKGLFIGRSEEFVDNRWAEQLNQPIESSFY